MRQSREVLTSAQNAGVAKWVFYELPSTLVVFKKSLFLIRNNFDIYIFLPALTRYQLLSRKLGSIDLDKFPSPMTMEGTFAFCWLMKIASRVEWSCCTNIKNEKYKLHRLNGFINRCPGCHSLHACSELKWFSLKRKLKTIAIRPLCTWD